MKKKTEWKRTCPKCGNEIFYTRKNNRNCAEKRNTNCRSCSSIGRFFSEETRKKLREVNLGDKNPAKRPEVRKKMSESKKGENHPFYGKKRSGETKKKMSFSAKKRIEEQNGQISPNYNPKAIPIIRAEAKKLGITDLRDAETPGGEFQVRRYFVDGFSKEKNIIIEYNESYHKYQTERDERRKQEIIKELGCKFIEIWE